MANVEMDLAYIDYSEQCSVRTLTWAEVLPAGLSSEPRLPAVAEAVLGVVVSLGSSRDCGKRDVLLGMLEIACDDIVVRTELLYFDDGPLKLKMMEYPRLKIARAHQVSHCRGGRYATLFLHCVLAALPAPAVFRSETHIPPGSPCLQ